MSQYDKLNTDLVNDSRAHPDDTFDQLKNSDIERPDYYSDEIWDQELNIGLGGVNLDQE